MTRTLALLLLVACQTPPVEEIDGATRYTHSCGSGGETESYDYAFPVVVDTETMPADLVVVYHTDPTYEEMLSFNLYTTPGAAVTRSYELDASGAVFVQCKWVDFSDELGEEGFVGFVEDTIAVWVR